MIAAKTLYMLGRIRGGNISFKQPPLREVWNSYSKNGTYAILAIEQLIQNPHISLTDLWSAIRRRIKSELGDEPARSNQGGATVAYKLWHLGLIIRSGTE